VLMDEAPQLRYKDEVNYSQCAAALINRVRSSSLAGTLLRGVGRALV